MANSNPPTVAPQDIVVGRVVLNGDKSLSVFPANTETPLRLQPHDELYQQFIRAHEAAIARAVTPESPGLWQRFRSILKPFARLKDRIVSLLALGRRDPQVSVQPRAPQFPPPVGIAHPLSAEAADEQSARVQEARGQEGYDRDDRPPQRPRPAMKPPEMATRSDMGIVASATSAPPGHDRHATGRFREEPQGDMPSRGNDLFSSISWNRQLGFTAVLPDGRTAAIANDDKLAEQFHALMEKLADRVRAVAASKEDVDMERLELESRAKELSAREAAIASKESEFSKVSAPVSVGLQEQSPPSEGAVKTDAKESPSDPRSGRDSVSDVLDTLAGAASFPMDAKNVPALLFIRSGKDGTPEAFGYSKSELVSLQLDRDQAQRAREVIGAGLLTVAQAPEEGRGINGIVNAPDGVGTHAVDEKVAYILGAGQLTGEPVTDPETIKSVIAGVSEPELQRSNFLDDRAGDKQAGEPSGEAVAEAEVNAERENAKRESEPTEDDLNVMATTLSEPTEEPDAPAFETLTESATIRPVSAREMKAAARGEMAPDENRAKPSISLDAFPDYKRREPALSRS